jgi:hypothetical protein
MASLLMPKSEKNTNSATRKRKSAAAGATNPDVVLNERGLPEHFSQYFWDCDFKTVSWRKHKESLVLRLLARGTWNDIQWFRGRVGDAWLRAWLVKRRGKAVDRPTLKFWALVLHIPEKTVSLWLADESRKIWDQRFQR